MQNAEGSTLKIWLSKNGWKLALFMLLFAFLIGGYYFGSMPPEKGDFTFNLPDGYRIAGITDKSCSILREADNRTVGGIEITELRVRDLKDNETRKISAYLRSEFHQTRNMEGFTSLWGNKHPLVNTHMTVYKDGTKEGHDYYHTFFERNSCVYHLWLDGALIAPEDESMFIAITGVD